MSEYDNSPGESPDDLPGQWSGNLPTPLLNIFSMALLVTSLLSLAALLGNLTGIWGNTLFAELWQSFNVLSFYVPALFFVAARALAKPQWLSAFGLLSFGIIPLVTLNGIFQVLLASPSNFTIWLGERASTTSWLWLLSGIFAVEVLFLLHPRFRNFLFQLSKSALQSFQELERYPENELRQMESAADDPSGLALGRIQPPELPADLFGENDFTGVRSLHDAPPDQGHQGHQGPQVSQPPYGLDLPDRAAQPGDAQNILEIQEANTPRYVEETQNYAVSGAFSRQVTDLATELSLPELRGIDEEDSPSTLDMLPDSWAAAAGAGLTGDEAPDFSEELAELPEIPAEAANENTYNFQALKEDLAAGSLELESLDLPEGEATEQLEASLQEAEREEESPFEFPIDPIPEEGGLDQQAEEEGHQIHDPGFDALSNNAEEPAEEPKDALLHSGITELGGLDSVEVAFEHASLERPPFFMDSKSYASEMKGAELAERSQALDPREQYEEHWAGQKDSIRQEKVLLRIQEADGELVDEDMADELLQREQIVGDWRDAYIQKISLPNDLDLDKELPVDLDLSDDLLQEDSEEILQLQRELEQGPAPGEPEELREPGESSPLVSEEMEEVGPLDTDQGDALADVSELQDSASCPDEPKEDGPEEIGLKKAEQTEDLRESREKSANLDRNSATESIQGISLVSEPEEGMVNFSSEVEQAISLHDWLSLDPVSPEEEERSETPETAGTAPTWDEFSYLDAFFAEESLGEETEESIAHIPSAGSAKKLVTDPFSESELGDLAAQLQDDMHAAETRQKTAIGELVAEVDEYIEELSEAEGGDPSSGGGGPGENTEDTKNGNKEDIELEIRFDRQWQELAQQIEWQNFAKGTDEELEIHFPLSGPTQAENMLEDVAGTVSGQRPDETPSEISGEIAEARQDELKKADESDRHPEFGENANSPLESFTMAAAAEQALRERKERAAQREEERSQKMLAPAVRKSWQSYDVAMTQLTEYDPDEEQRNSQIDEDTKKSGEALLQTLHKFKIEAQMMHILKGPSITEFGILPAPGIKLNRVEQLADNLAMELAARSIRIVAPIPGKKAVGVEIPNRNRSTVSFPALMDSEDMHRARKDMELPIILGKEINGDIQIADLRRMPHLLIAGATGSGKSICVNVIISSLILSRTPQQLRLMLIDPKIVELKQFNEIPHLLTPVITDAQRALQALQWVSSEMERRYALLDAIGAGNKGIESYNRYIAAKNMATMPLEYIVVIIDEFADLMSLVGKELEGMIARLAAMSRAVGIHLVLATQRPSVDVVTGLIKANFPTRIAFMVASQTDSRTILDMKGAEQLLGQGDMLFSLPGQALVRVQGAFLSEVDTEKITDYIRSLGQPAYLDEIIFEDEEEEETHSLESGGDDLFPQAVEIALQAGEISTSFLQRKLSIGYNRAARIIDEMEERGIIGPAQGSKKREVLHAY